MPPVSAMLIMFMHLVTPSRHPSHDVDHHERRVERLLHFSHGLLHEHSFATECVQRRLVCSVGVYPAGVEVSAP